MFVCDVPGSHFLMASGRAICRVRVLLLGGPAQTMAAARGLDIPGFSPSTSYQAATRSSAAAAQWRTSFASRTLLTGRAGVRGYPVRSAAPSDRASGLIARGVKKDALRVLRQSKPGPQEPYGAALALIGDLDVDGAGGGDAEGDTEGSLPGDVARSLAIASREPIDFTTLRAVSSEINQTLCPAKVEGCLQISPVAACLRLRGLSGVSFLVLSWDPEGPTLSLAPRNYTPPSVEPSTLVAMAHARLRNAILTSCDLPAPFDRVLRLSFSSHQGEPPQHHLCLEPRGAMSYLTLLDAATSHVLAIAHHGAVSPLRGLELGKPYVPPPAPPGLTPTPESLAPGSLRGALTPPGSTGSDGNAAAGEARDGGARGRPPTLVAALTRAFCGMSPRVAREVCWAAGVDSAATAAALGPAEWEALSGALERWRVAVTSGDFLAGALVPEGGFTVLGFLHGAAAAAGPDARPRFAEVPGADGSVLNVLQLVSGQAAERRQHEELQSRLDRAVREAQRRAEGKLRSVERQMSQAAEHESVAHVGELLAANIWRMELGMRSIEVDDWTTGEKVTLELDPSLRPHEQVDAWFKKARKARRGSEFLGPLIEEAKSRLEWLSSVQMSLAAVGPYSGPGDLQVLREILAEMEEAGAMPAGDGARARKAAGKESKATQKAARRQGPPFRRFTTPSGLPVLVGRNNRQNDELSIKVAREQDVWMHARHVPGAHVVLRIEPGQKVQDDDIAFAAGLAVHFSKAKSSPRFDVTMCYGKDVRKPKGAPPGMVTVATERVVSGVPALVADAVRGSGDDGAGEGGA